MASCSALRQVAVEPKCCFFLFETLLRWIPVGLFLGSHYFDACPAGVVTIETFSLWFSFKTT